MSHFRPFCAALISALALTLIAGCNNDSNSPSGLGAGRVLLISVDGLHQQDLAYCLANATCPNLAALAQTGVIYSNAVTPGLSDSFPGLAALVTGGSPKSAGLFYDVSYDRTVYAPSDKTCSGVQGWQVIFDETTGIDAMNGGPLIHLNGGGAFNPQAIPNAKVNGACTPVYPHNYIKTNTIFEAIKQGRAGARTAWADKHAWGYDWVNGPSGSGVDDLARTEINSIDPVTGTDFTDVYTHTQVFDNLHVQIILNQIDGKDSTGAAAAPVPTIFGTNFQTLSVAQKALNAKGGGYKDANFTPNPQVAAAMAYVDAAIGKMISELKATSLFASTMIVVTAKHGQSPTDHSLLVKHGDTLTNLLQTSGYLDAGGNWGQNSTTSGNLNDGTGLSGTGAVQTDDVGLIWLKDPSQVPAVVSTLQGNAGCTAPGICADRADQAYILSGAQMVSTFGDPAQGRTPDIIVQPNYGVIYTSSGKKDMEHGGNAPDDRHVALLVSYPSISATTDSSAVGTVQVAPTMLKALGLDPNLLKSVASEGTAVLPSIQY